MCWARAMNATNDSSNNTHITLDMENIPYENLYLGLRFATGLICYPIFCVFGLSGNVLSLFVLSHKKMKSSTNTYLQALAVSDSIKLLCDFTYFLTILLFNVNPAAGNKMYGYLYPYAHYFFNMPVCTTAWITVSVAAERYILVCHATRAKRICNLDRARTISITVFIAMTIFTIPFALRYRTITTFDEESNDTKLDVEETELWQDKTFVPIYTWTHNIVRSIIPLVILCTLNCFIMHALWRTKSSRKRMSSRQRITLMLVSVIIVFLVCVTPDTILTVIGYGYHDAPFPVRAVREITDLLLLINSAVNFVLYCTFNKMFRKSFLEMFCRCTTWSKKLFGDKVTNLSRHTSIGGNCYVTRCYKDTEVDKEQHRVHVRLYPKYPPLCHSEHLTDKSTETSC